MKLQIFNLFLIVNILITACNNQPPAPLSRAEQEKLTHRKHTLLRDNLAHKEIIILDEPYKSLKQFGQTFNTFFSTYLKLQEALVKADTVVANRTAEKMKLVLQLTPEPAQEKKATAAWENHKKGYLKNIVEFIHAKELEKKRSYFSHLSEIMYCSFKSFDLERKDIYLIFCPMAFQNKGAYWLAESQEIKNPYLGDKMLKCGTIEETL